ncbi:hypothetical protein QQZ08_001460 [Neonectria magnoliae]|uniref:Nephrocystin 3-like N-terminal domain-containing protein n=1 Tax=Neonectria magnoliae TaxID=2732573 RepID=A0ABR1IFR6_9HYPO
MMNIGSQIKGASNSSSRWSSFRVALKSYWKRDEIAQIEEGLKKTVASSHIEDVQHIEYLSQDPSPKFGLATFRREIQTLGTQHSTQLESMEAMLQRLVERQREHAPETPSLPAEALSTELSILERMMTQLGISERRVNREISILRSLGFESRKVRHCGIPVAHQETFQWAFDPDPTATDGGNLQKGANDLLNWLRNGQETFWVSGKPGSGKSTFVKYLADHPQPRSKLSKWSHPHPVVIASHYFWSPGTDMQKSQQGLLQGLLHDIFRHCPDLIEATCESRWVEEDRGNQSSWNNSELWATLQALYLQTQVSHKFCFFIDGIDEFWSENFDMVDFCEDLISTFDVQNINLCLSSRPWNVIEDAFGQVARRKLYIHELTRVDKLNYAKHRLYKHPRWRMFQKRNKGAESLT